MNRISRVFKQPHHKALVSYIMAGYPSVESTINTIPLLEKNGVDIVEIGIPFSDPLADGATIQKAGFKALKNGTSVEICFEIAEKLKNKVKIPLVFMTYFNPVMNCGVDKFCRECARTNVSGLIIPDLPPDEGTELEQAALKNGIDLIYLITPNTSAQRIKLVSYKSSGFVYLVSVTGITGARKNLPSYLDSFVKKVKKATDKPLCIGFGISTVPQAVKAAKIADGVIIGSKIVQLMGEKNGNAELRDFIRAIRAALDGIDK